MKFHFHNLGIALVGIAGFIFVLLPAIIPIISGRALTSVETGLTSVFGLILSLYAAWYFTKERSDFSKFKKYLHMTHYASERMGLVRVEPSLRLGTRAQSAIATANTSISFLGIAGGKFLENILNEKTTIGRKIVSGNVKLRLLFLNPDGEQVKRWTRNAKQIKKTQQSIKKSLALVNQIKRPVKDALQFRLYDHEPPMRILIVDDRNVYVSRYSADSEDGWEIPQLCFTARNAIYPMSASFVSLFNFLWELSKK
ncbi:MAG: hypothetical protein ACNYWU_07240 [Desulfobacterales bacterium]